MGGDLTKQQQQIGEETEREKRHKKAATHGGTEQRTPQSRRGSGEHKNTHGCGNTVAQLATSG